jgi:hypothetical protein
VTDKYNGSWIYWNGANSKDAQPLAFVSLKRRVDSCGSYSGCLYEEVFGATIPDATLKAHRDGLSVKFYAQTGKEMVIRLSANQIAQQLRAIDDYQGSKK